MLGQTGTKPDEPASGASALGDWVDGGAAAACLWVPAPVFGHFPGTGSPSLGPPRWCGAALG